MRNDPAPAAAPGLGFGPGSVGSNPDVMGILQRESQIRAGMGELQDQINFNGGNGIGFRKTTNDELVRDMLVNGNSRDRSAALGFMAGGREANMKAAQAAQEHALSQQRQDLANADFGLRREAQGFQSTSQRQIQALQQQYIAETDPAKKTEIERSIRLLSGQAVPRQDFEMAKARSNLIGELGKQFAAYPPIGADKKPIPFETWAEPMLRAAGFGQPKAVASPSVPPAASAALLADPNKAAEFDAKYGAGAAAKVLAAR